MSDSKYQSAIRQSITKNGSTTYRWPERIEGLGERVVGAIASCRQCPRKHYAEWTFVRYGKKPLCLKCALALSAQKTNGAVPERATAPQRKEA